MGKVVLVVLLLGVIAVQTIVIHVLKQKYQRFKKEVDIERRINYSHFD